MRDYSKAKIYKITNDLNYKVYIGSTCKPLEIRWTKHRNFCNRAYMHINEVMNDLGVDHFKLELVEDFPCENKEELLEREDYHIKQFDSIKMGYNRRLNKRLPVVKEYKTTKDGKSFGRKEGWRSKKPHYRIKTYDEDGEVIDEKEYCTMKEITEEFGISSATICRLHAGKIKRIDENPHGGSSSSRLWLKTHTIERL